MPAEPSENRAPPQSPPETGRQPWDCVIVGGGPAGLSAAIYMGRFSRRTLVIDDGKGRWRYGQPTENYLGFPNGVSARRLHRLGVLQASRFGVEITSATVSSVALEQGLFRVDTVGGLEWSRTLIWATGVVDIWPRFPHARSLVGRSLFWCIVCDGWRTRGQRVVLFGDDDSAAETALQFLTYTPHLVFVTHPSRSALSARGRDKLREQGIRVLDTTVERPFVEDGELRCVRLADGTAVEADFLFSLLGNRPRTELLAAVPVSLNERRHVAIDDKNRTDLPGFFAAGDVTDKHAHQVAAAVHEGAQAAMAANHALYPGSQRL